MTIYAILKLRLDEPQFMDVRELCLHDKKCVRRMLVSVRFGLYGRQMDIGAGVRDRSG